MNAPLTRATALLSFAAALALPAAAAPATSADTLIDTALLSMQDAPSSWAEAFAQGTGSISFNYRYEEVDQTGFSKNAHASTLRTVVGFKTASYENFSGFIQFENTSIVGNEHAFTTANRPTVADFRGPDLNQAYIDYSTEMGLFRLGRQEVIFDNARFVGNVGWRQNHQSFDALAWVAPADFPVAITAAYVNNVNTITGGDLRTDTYLLNVSKNFEDVGKLTVYGYSLDVHAAPTASTLTIGARFAGAMDMGDMGGVDYTLEYANQSDNADNTLSIDADYYRIEVGGELSGIKLGIGQELLGSDAGTIGFATPLATKHAHNGWADKFLGTPANGLEDTFIRVGGKVSDVNLLAVYHDYAADEGGADYGTELDLLAKYKVNKQTVVGLKYADYSADTFATDTQKIWFWLTWTPSAK
jgi:hypothetical protein